MFIISGLLAYKTYTVDTKCPRMHCNSEHAQTGKPTCTFPQLHYPSEVRSQLNMALCPITQRARWWSRAKVLKSKGKDTTARRDETWRCGLAFYCNILTYITVLKLQLPGTGVFSPWWRLTKTHKRSRLTDAQLHSILTVSTAQNLTPKIDEPAAQKRCQASSSSTSSFSFCFDCLSFLTNVDAQHSHGLLILAMKRVSVVAV